GAASAIAGGKAVVGAAWSCPFGGSLQQLHQFGSADAVLKFEEAEAPLLPGPDAGHEDRQPARVARNTTAVTGQVPHGGGEDFSRRRHVAGFGGGFGFRLGAEDGHGPLLAVVAVAVHVAVELVVHVQRRPG